VLPVADHAAERVRLPRPRGGAGGRDRAALRSRVQCGAVRVAGDPAHGLDASGIRGGRRSARPHAGCAERDHGHRARAPRRAPARRPRRAARARAPARCDRDAAVHRRADAPHRAVHGNRRARRRRRAPLCGGPQHVCARGDLVRDAVHVPPVPAHPVALVVAAVAGAEAPPMTTSSAPRETHRTLLADFDARRPAALARAVSIVENHRAGFEDVLGALHSRLGRARRIGITGPPGAGKSTITTTLAARYRAAGLSAGIIAVDPTSPFTGGALLGDRIRMESVALDGYGFDRILIETVGVGQSELDIARTADTTVVVLVPESGDSVQAMKAGLMEIADVFVVNKADRPDAERLRHEIEMTLGLRLGGAMRNVPAHHGVDLKKLR